MLIEIILNIVALIIFIAVCLTILWCLLFTPPGQSLLFVIVVMAIILWSICRTFKLD